MTFKLDGFDFGIDLDRSSFKIDGNSLQFVINGNTEIFEAVFNDEEAPWSWSLYPPTFYIRGLEIFNLKDSLCFDYEITEDDIDEYEIDFFMMEYCTVYPCKISFKNGVFKVFGEVHDLKESPVEMYIEWLVQ